MLNELIRFISAPVTRDCQRALATFTCVHFPGSETLVRSV